MVIVAILAGDLAALSAILPAIPNPGLALMVAILQIGLFVAVARRGPARAFWIGFEVFGWAYVLTCFASNRAAWALARSLFEVYVLRAEIRRPGEMWSFILFAGGLQLVLSMAVAQIGGWLFRRITTERLGGLMASDGPPIPPADGSEPNSAMQRTRLRRAADLGR
jgi:hypothetical protein